MRRNRIHPGAKEVQDQFESIKQVIEVFFDPDIPFNGLIICGAAGMGKTHQVMKTLKEMGICEENRNCYVVKGQVSSAQFYIDLYVNSKEGQVLVIDDADIIGLDKGERNSIIDFIKSATDVKFGQREVQRNKINKNQKMKELDVPERFDFQGSLVWITNEIPSSMKTILKGHWEALSSRCDVYTLDFDDDTKFNYTKYLIEDEDIYGLNCYDKEGGYRDEEVELLLDFMDKHHNNLLDWTPRRSFKAITQILVMMKMGKTNEEILRTLYLSFVKG